MKRRSNQLFFSKQNPLNQTLFRGIAVIKISFILVVIPLFKTLAQSPLDLPSQQAMIEGIEDEYRARALYNGVIQKLGEVRPLSNIVRAENNHIQLWNYLFEKYGIPIPSDRFAETISIPNTLETACQAGVENEIANVELYNRLLGVVTQADLKAAIMQLRQVSQERHLIAFQHCQNHRRVPF